MKIYHVIPWTTDKNLGRFYNQAMELIKEDDWICFLDADAIHTTTYFGKYIEKIIEKNPEYGMFTGRTNKILCSYQLYNGFNYNQDLDYHRKIGTEAWEKFGTEVTDITNKKELIGGFLLLINKKSWLKVGGFKENLMLGIDNDIHEKFKIHKLKFGLMLGIYIQHWYRGEDIENKTHLFEEIQTRESAWIVPIEKDFDEKFYYEKYPDIRNWYVEDTSKSLRQRMFHHYFLYGKKEGRINKSVDLFFENGILNYKK